MRQIDNGMDKNTDIKALAANTKNVYERCGLRYDAERSKILFERKWLRRFEALLPERAAILDVGCRAAEPIARYFIQNGHEVTGIGFATVLLAQKGKTV